MNANRILFSPGQCRIIFSVLVALLTLWGYRFHLPSGGAASPPVPAEGGQKRPSFVLEVTGAIVRPGVYGFFHRADVAEVIREAGGLKSGAFVPVDLVHTVPESGSLLTVGTDPASTTITLMDPRKRFLYYVPFVINQASAEELLLVPGIGEKTARAIVCYRERHGPFPRLESLLEVPGIGRHTFDRLRDFLVL